MPSTHTITQSIPTPADSEYLEARLYAHNRDRTGQDDGELFGFLVRDDEGHILAGITGWTWARACEIQRLWVDEAWRGQEYGRQLLDAAEQHARARGCEVVALDSYSFQAPDFYQKHGYELASALEDFPPGHRRCHLVKRLRAGKGE